MLLTTTGSFFRPQIIVSKLHDITKCSASQIEELVRNFEEKQFQAAKSDDDYLTKIQERITKIRHNFTARSGTSQPGSMQEWWS